MDEVYEVDKVDERGEAEVCEIKPEDLTSDAVTMKRRTVPR